MERANEGQHNFKVVIVGNTGAGKSNIISRFSTNEFGRCQSTIGCESHTKKIQLHGKKIKLILWDTAGQQRYQSISHVYFKNALGVILTYDITNEDSFNKLSTWYGEFEQHAPADAIAVVAGNKKDLQANRKVSTDRGTTYAKQKGLQLFQVSAASGQNINSMFNYLLQKFTERLKSQKSTDKVVPKNINLANPLSTNQKNKRCC